LPSWKSRFRICRASCRTCKGSARRFAGNAEWDSTCSQRAGSDDELRPPINQAPPLEQAYQAALSDFNAAKYPLATNEFQDVIHSILWIDGGRAQFYLGEIDYRNANYDDAVKAYDVVLEQFSGNPKARPHSCTKDLRDRTEQAAMLGRMNCAR